MQTQKKKETRSSTNHLESELAKFIGDESAITIMKYNPLDNHKTQIWGHKHVKNDENLKKFNLQKQVRISTDKKKYRTECMIMLSDFESIWDGPLVRNEAA